jgi:hypothetical protein
VGLKHGRIIEETTPNVSNPKIHRFRLDTGVQVYVPSHIAHQIIAGHSPSEEFFFVERGLLGRTDWAGTLPELREAVSVGTVRASELGSFRLPESQPSTAWKRRAVGDHRRPGGKLPQYRAVFTKHGRHGEAAQLTAEAWLANGQGEGFCLATRDDPDHETVWCSLDRGHPGPHEGDCPECWLVAMIQASTGK